MRESRGQFCRFLIRQYKRLFAHFFFVYIFAVAFLLHYLLIPFPLALSLLLVFFFVILSLLHSLWIFHMLFYPFTNSDKLVRRRENDSPRQLNRLDPPPVRSYSTLCSTAIVLKINPFAALHLHSTRKSICDVCTKCVKNTVVDAWIKQWLPWSWRRAPYSLCLLQDTERISIKLFDEIR